MKTASLFQLSSLRLPLCAAMTALLGACASYQGIAPGAKAIEQVNLPAIQAAQQTQDAWPHEDWWRAFGDAQLDRLMNQALTNSPSLALAQSRIARAQAASSLANAGSGPQATLNTDASYGRQSENYVMPKPPLGKGGEYVSTGRAAIDFGLDLDLWGRNAALIRAANAQLDASRYDHDAARLALTTSIARSYAQLAAQYELQDVLLATQKQRQSIRTLTDQRIKSGLDTRVEQKQAESSEASIRADLAQLNTSMEATRLQLAALSGQMPTAAREIGRPALSAPAYAVPQNLPLDLLARRPELAAQRARILAALGDADAAKAQFYPNINLTAFLGFQAIGLNNLLSAGSMVSGIGPAIHLPLFDSGHLRANYAGKVADIDGAIAQYNQSVLTAAQDVAEQLTRIAALSTEEEATQAALAASEEAYRVAMLRYRGGLSPYLTALTVETQLLAQRRAAADLRARRLDLQVALVRALGGGFHDNAAPLATNKH
ncbi:NodT family efflux transporter outer membrane factor (OMF) lipoprotein [Paucimonas lemoignei]|uniref:NodT family efflux transporter outer membrane factor (OMF) lipoprotein n=1 Tax=Paucimonas lemoignei TaxID=29443 RepID=A0A4R3HSC7_PAULE|nr:efflux transporter outer membrane subunit [Paucimonas lemoignei]TCS36056.1 NodT family efflux transporter outer membrane factor (OMF) lipoprotein [Paucimonas lemoignei]